jgi:F-type H+-transporting ATPase subunit a
LTTHAHAEATPRRIGLRRWIFLGLMILGAFLAWNVGGIWRPVPPAVVLPAEPAWAGLVTEVAPGVSFGLTNTFFSALIVALILFAIALFAVQPHLRSGQDVPSNFFYHVMEVGVEFFWNTTQSLAGKWARQIFPFTMTIFLVVLVANLFKLVPIHETIGYTKKAHGTIQGYATVPVAGGIHLLDGSRPFPKDQRVEETAAESHGGEAEHGAKSEYWNSAEPCKDCEVVPTLRGAATDLNFTLSLALVTMIMVQVFGVRALGAGYFSKFINLTTIIKKPMFGLIDFLVGILELISEFAKVLSFSLRLFGVIFAGTLLLAIVSTLNFSGAQPFAFFVPGLLVGLELFVGIIQAYVFSTLALTFMSQATVSHHGDEHAEAH